MSIIVSICQHCDEQQFQTLSCVHYTIFSVVKLDLFIRALLLDRILVFEKTTRTPRVHLVLEEIVLCIKKYCHCTRLFGLNIHTRNLKKICQLCAFCYNLYKDKKFKNIFIYFFYVLIFLR